MTYRLQFLIAGSWRGLDGYSDLKVALADMDLRDGRDRRGEAKERRVIDEAGNVIKMGRWCTQSAGDVS